MGEEVKVVVPESVLKKRKREEEWALAKKQGLEAAKKKNAENRKLIYNRAKQYSEEYKEQEKELIRLKREAKLKGGFYVDPEAKLLFIIRIRGINAIDPKTKKILQLLRLRQLFPRVNSDVDKSNSSSSVPELIMVQEVWFPFVFSSENASRERGAANNSEGPVDSSGFQLLIQDLADATDEGSFNLLFIVCRYHELGSSERVFIEHASDLLGTKLPSILEFACVVRFNGMNDGFA